VSSKVSLPQLVTILLEPRLNENPIAILFEQDLYTRFLSIGFDRVNIKIKMFLQAQNCSYLKGKIHFTPLKFQEFFNLNPRVLKLAIYSLKFQKVSI
jgi:hypothetical protein